MKLIGIGVPGVMFHWRNVGLWRRDCLRQPKARMIEDTPDHRRRRRVQKSMLVRQHSKDYDMISENATLEKFAL